jgi:hypothetical protein
VVIDSSEAGQVRPGETLELPVEAGSHVVQIAIDWARSQALDVDVAEGETVHLRCAPNTAQSALAGITYGRGKYVSLWRAPSADSDWSEELLPVPWGRFALLALLLASLGLSLAYGRTVEAVLIALLALVPAVVIVAWVYARIRR